MTIIHGAARERLTPENSPPDCPASSAGMFVIRADGTARFDRHHHDIGNSGSSPEASDTFTSAAPITWSAQATSSTPPRAPSTMSSMLPRSSTSSGSPHPSSPARTVRTYTAIRPPPGTWYLSLRVGDDLRHLPFPRRRSTASRRGQRH